MDRNAASNKSIRMKHGTTILHITPLNRNTRFSIPEENALQASSSYVPAQWRSPSSPSSLIVPTSYSAQVPIPPPGSRFSAPPYHFPPPYITLSNMSTSSKFPKRSQYSTPPYVPPSSCPPYTTQSSMPVYTSLSSSLTYTSQSSTTSNTDQTSKFPKRSQYPTPHYVPPYSCPSYITRSSMPVYSSQSSTMYNTSQTSASAYSPRYPTPTNSTAYSEPTYTSRSSTSTYNLSPSPRMNHQPEACNESYPSYSHFTFPRSVDYTHPWTNVWPTEIGSVMQAAMQRIYLVLDTEKIASDSTKTASNSCASNHNEKLEKALMSVFISENIDTQLRRVWLYFNKLEVVDFEPNGKIKCICPVTQFEDFLKLSINDKRLLVKLQRNYEIKNLLFEEKYDYNSSPPNTIVTEKMENEVLQWLTSLKMEEYDWFFNSLSLSEIENISLTNIQKFIKRSKSNKTISSEDKLKICCMVKKIKEWPVSLMAIAMNLQEDRIDEEPFRSTVHPFITEIFLFPTSIFKHFLYDDIMNKSIIYKMIAFQIYKTNGHKIRYAGRYKYYSNMGDSLDIEMVNSEINYTNQLFL